jgi:hypothetical protein
MSQIDWSRAPKGFPLWLEGTNEDHRKHSGWYRRAGEVFEGACGGQWRAVREGQFFNVHSKPESAPAWTGEGLPPVGTVCQLKNVESGSEWREVAENGSKVTIIAHYMNAGTPLAAFTVGVIGESFTVDSATESFFEPIRTPEQIAAEERGRSVEQMVADLRLLIVGGKEFSVCEALYDAGYRKQAEK